MNERAYGPGRPVLTWPLHAAALCAALCVGLAASPVCAAERIAAGKCISATGTMVRRELPRQPWRVVDGNETLYGGDLLVGMPGAKIESRNGAVELAFWTDLTGTAPRPVMESAVVLHDVPGADVDVTLDRGRVLLTNRKKAGAAHAQLHVQHGRWELTLAGPGAAVALELYGRWPAGSRFTPKPGPKDVPIAELTFLVSKGDLLLAHQGIEHRMHAPSLIEWDNFNGMDDAPRRLDALPDWARPGLKEAPEVKERRLIREQVVKAIQTQSIDKTLDQLVNSDNPTARRFGVFAMAALDELAGLAKVMRETKHADVWDQGVLALRHWIGRGPGQDQRLYKALIEVGKYPPVDAETTVQLLHSFGDEDLARPEVYEALLDYLDDERLAIRGLAYWHLKRLVPAGVKFGYDPTASKESRAAALAKWKKLIPPGHLPPREKQEGK